ncbi:MAG: hypothetical protein D6803_00980 [Anaerolineae bacterium]|nr:MAG: hypothetical protein D6803_00980 [Anaerolineae bacterium]
MLTSRELQELLDFNAGHPVTSVYLNTDPAQGNADVYRLKLRNLLKEAQPPAEDAERILRFFEQEYDGEGRSVAVFSCQAEAFFRTFAIAVPIESRIRLSPNRPHVKPLLRLLDAYGHYGVAVVDRQSARLFAFHLGELLAEEQFSGESVQRIKQGGGSQAGGQRGGEGAPTIEEIAERNMKAAAELSARFFKQHDVRRVLIGGTEENCARFIQYLPRHWQSLLMGTFPVDMNAPYPEIREKALEIGRQAERKREERLVSSVITGALKGQNGTLGLEDTLLALQEGRVQTLLIHEGLRQPGKRCTKCHYLTSNGLQACPYCGQPFEDVPDVVEIASQRVMRAHGEVEFVLDPALKQHGGIGALLRY